MNVMKRSLKLKTLRQDGLVPGVLYGNKFDSVSIQMKDSDFKKAISKYGTSKTFSINLDGEKHIVYIKDTQQAYMDYNSYLHFDLMKVSKGDTIHASIPIHLIGKEKFEKSAYICSQNLDELDVEYAVGKGVSHIDFDVSDMTQETPKYVNDLIIPKGVKVLSDPTEVVCSLLHVKAEAEPEETSDEVTVVPHEEPEEAE